MSFTSIAFLLFVLVAAVGYYLIPKRFQWCWLLLFSYIYYAAAGLWYLPFLLTSTLSTYGAGRWLGRITARIDDKKAAHAKKRGVLIGTLLLNFGILAVLKYTNFTIGNINGLFGCDLASVNWLLPLGISFYTFQSMGYLMDVYWARVKPEKNVMHFALFVSFFPQLLQGPIGRYSRLAEQLYVEHRFDAGNMEDGFRRILWGYFKKIVIADNAAIFVGIITQNYADVPGVTLPCLLLYSAQLYGDFSGGMDIVIGIASLFGIKLDENFRQPFFARSITDFWHRWHITLGTWMKDYVFYPLTLSGWMHGLGTGCKRLFGKKIGRTLPICLANLIVFFLVGVWHGANWTYIGYGLYNGLIIAFSGLMADTYRSWKKTLHIRDDAWWWIGFQILRTFLLVNLSWLFDISANMEQVVGMFGNMLHQPNFAALFGTDLLAQTHIRQSNLLPTFLFAAVGCVILLAVSIQNERGKAVSVWLQNRPLLVRGAVYVVLMLMIAGMGQPPSTAGGFIYANF